MEPKALVAEYAAFHQRIAQLSEGLCARTDASCARPAHRLLELVLEAISFPLYVIDANTHKIVLANPATAQSPIPRDATCYELTHHRSVPCDGSEGSCPLTEVRRTKKPVITEHVHANRLGVPKHYEIHAFPICDENGEVTQVVEYNVDITERKRAQEDVREYQRWLEMMVEDLRRSNDELRELSSLAAHDIRSPLAGISTAATALKGILHGKLNERERRVFDILVSAVDRTNEMVASLYRCGQVSSGHLQRTEVDLNRLVHELMTLQLRTDIEGSRGTIHIPETLHVVSGDEMQILELLQNLIANGLKYHRPGIAPEITIRSRRTETGSVRVTVADNGIGIRTADCETVFLMFKRLDDARGREGLGIGLAFCKRVAEQHGGRIGVRSTYGAGSTFWVEFPDDSRPVPPGVSTPVLTDRD